MAILIDPPRWPAHGYRWSHLVSDVSLDELHAFARSLGLPRRSFDLDHYDVAEFNYDRAISAGAVPVSGHALVRALRASGLRVRQVDRGKIKSVRREEFLLREWSRLGERLQLGEDTRWTALGWELLGRWNEPHRSYHDQRHLEDVLLALDQLAIAGEQIQPVTLLAAWFHDAVYAGALGEDERASAELAQSQLVSLGVPVRLIEEVHDCILATTPETPFAEVSRPFAQMLDADLAIFAAGERRYAEYAEAVRVEYAHVSEPDFRRGRAQILRRYLARPRIYRLESANTIWEARARHNLNAEVQKLSAN
ncbi:DUF4031 domain-containing protein [Gulosibacter chungangensis]|uniref:DUF4031 domain-containing protein n=1 Tax=Gulosibacter chungangensis TaxID=979746 RepID=A0A7J5BD81_9MICO|nr:DUF4031 domain-containing protein [Gulosibacter chungangensis]KAB1644167.1 DUF4031 domain-containing protein [Gulosibacter chungangensis]